MSKKIRRTAWCVLLTALLFLFAATAAAEETSQQAAGLNSGAAKGIVFTDVDSTDANAMLINYLANRGLVKGFSDGTYRPGAGLSRAEAAAMLARAAELPQSEAGPRFSDVRPGHWAAGVITAATEAGYLGGYSDGTFRPDAVLSRAEGLALLLRLSGQEDPGVALPALADVNPDHWAARPIAVGIASGMLGLSADQTRFGPDAPFTRGDLARVLGIILTGDSSYYETTLTGSIKAVRGTVDITRSNEKITVKTGAETEIMAGDGIKTGAGAVAEIAFPDGSGLLLQENTSLTVKEARGRSYFKADGTPGLAVDWLALDLKHGEMFGALASRYETSQVEQSQAEETGAAGVKKYPVLASLDNSVLAGIIGPDGKMLLAQQASGKSLPWWEESQAKKVKVQVDMPWGVAAIRGTFWSNLVGSNGSSGMSLLTGEGQMTSGGQTVPLTGGQSSTVSGSGAPPSPPSPMTGGQRQAWTQPGVANWAQQRAGEIQNNMGAQPPPPPGSPGQPGQQAGGQQPGPNVPGIINNAIREAGQSGGSNSGRSSSSSGSNDNNQSELVRSINADNSRITMEFNRPVADAYIDDANDWFPVVTLANGTKYKIWMTNKDREPDVCLHGVSHLSNTVEIITFGAEPEMEYILTVYTGNEFDQTVFSANVTFTDSTPPVFADGYPDFDNITANSVDLYMLTNEMSIVYYIVSSEEYELLPPAEMLKTWVENHVDGSGFYWLYDEPERIPIDSLEGNTHYTLYYFAEDAWGNMTEVESIGFQTADTEPPQFLYGPAIENRNIINDGEGTFDLVLQTEESATYYYVILSDLDASEYGGALSDNEVVKDWAQNPEATDYIFTYTPWSGWDEINPSSEPVMIPFTIVDSEQLTNYRIFITLEDEFGNMTEVIDEWIYFAV